MQLIWVSRIAIKKEPFLFRCDFPSNSSLIEGSSNSMCTPPSLTINHIRHINLSLSKKFVSWSLWCSRGFPRSFICFCSGGPFPAPIPMLIKLCARFRHLAKCYFDYVWKAPVSTRREDRSLFPEENWNVTNQNWFHFLRNEVVGARRNLPSTCANLRVVFVASLIRTRISLRR